MQRVQQTSGKHETAYMFIATSANIVKFNRCFEIKSIKNHKTSIYAQLTQENTL